jgi:aminopeptidase N
VVLNAHGLSFDHVTLDGVAAQSVAMDAKLDRATLTFPRAILAGLHKLAIDYHGPITKGTLGFFAMDYDSAAGPRRTLATNFEPTSARALLPCWDEPADKATFTVSIDAPKDRMAVGNMPVAEITPLTGDLQRVRFAETPKMSTYLLFLSVGDYERVHREVDGVDVGIVVKRGDLDRAAYALDQASALLHYYNGYFGVRFPLPKLDLIAAPGQITGGSMENWGSIFYSQNHLLFDPKTSTEHDRQLVFEVVAHEMAHQWFGDLVTMAWWDNLWLNEGFARWMQTHAADALHPEWRTGLQAQRIFESGKRADAKPSTHPVLQPILSAEQAIQAFDNITYDKGAAVITMLEAYVGPANFEEGVQRYMRAHAYGNTVDSDLWGQMQTVAGKPILEIERDFTRQSGLPLIRTTTDGAMTALQVGRFYEDPAAAAPTSQSWLAPLVVEAPGALKETLLLKDKATIAAPTPLVNAGALTYARVAYAPAQVQALTARLPKLGAADQMNLMNDAWALGQAGYASAADLAAYMSRLPIDADPIVWDRLVDLTVAIDHDHGPGPQRDAYRRFALALLAPVAARLGPAAQPGEDPAATTLRSAIWSAEARFGDAAALARAKAIFVSQTGSATEKRTALAIVASSADAATFDALLAKARATADPLARSRILAALAGVADPRLAARFTEVALSPLAPAGSAPSLLARAAATNPDAVWAALSPHLDDPALPIDDTGRFIPDIAGASADPARIADIRRYADRHIPADARQGVEAAIASIQLNARGRDHAIPEIDQWVADHPSN